METKSQSIINIEILSIIIASIGVFGYWYLRETVPWYRILFAELFGAGILTAVLPLAIFLEDKLNRIRLERLEKLINQPIQKRIKILDIIHPKKETTITMTFLKISNIEAKKRIIEYLKIQIKKGIDTTDIFTISKALNIPARQINNVIKRKNKRFK